MELRLVKEGSYLAPYDTASEEWLLSKGSGQYFVCDLRTPRNYEFHKKFFALLNIAFPYWNPDSITNQYGEVERSFDQFREDITILSGYFEQTFRVDGSVRVRAKSISFSAMDNEDFSVFYNKAVSAVIKHVLIGWTIEQVDEAIGGFL